VNAYKILVRKSEMNRPLEKPRRRSETNTKMDLRGIDWKFLNWMDLDQFRD